MGEQERIRKVLRALARELNARKHKLTQRGVATMQSYRPKAPDSPPPVLVVVDNYAALRQQELRQLVDILDFLLREGFALDVHVALTSNTHGEVPSDLRRQIGLTIDMEIVKPEPYSLEVSENGEVLPMQHPRWRGFVQQAVPVEFFPMLPVDGATGIERATTIAALCARMPQR